MSADKLQVQIAYARPERQYVIDVEVPLGSTIEYVIECSRILEALPEIDLARNPVGIYGVVRSLGTRVAHGDRVEIYRPLAADPKDARRRRAR